MSAYEVEAAQVASLVTGPSGVPLSPRVEAVRGGRPVLEFVPGPRLHDLVADGPELPAAAGGVLARLHAWPCPVNRVVELEVPATEPVDFATYLGMSPDQRRVLADLHRDPELADLVGDVLRAARFGRAWCHGAARADNFCVRDGVPQLIDWEATGTGRPEVDLAALAASVLAGRLAAATPAARDSATVRTDVNVALRAARTDLRSVMAGYAAAGGRARDTPLLASLTGVSLLSRALTRSATGPLDRATALMVQIGSTLVRRPDRWHTLTDPRG
ncbi:phosphotransferase [Nonomuraea lactucae]|uniref:phosphotransferase n=1 Tax=Nonomuraea lactucae TaxID=2249762 RepID=UPI000DE54941|nr:phosphotransferase [Nonomuraea lactucae]